jgi:hypothetical protein
MVIEKHLPAWFNACASEGDAIVLHEKAFGMSGSELFLFACAIKYAAGAGKTVHVTCGEPDITQSRFHSASAEDIFREKKLSRPTQRNAARRPARR